MLMRPLGVLLALRACTGWAQKTDRVVVSNGDRFTGEIKYMTRGLLRLSTDSAGTIYVEWLVVTDHSDGFGFFPLVFGG